MGRNVILLAWLSSLTRVAVISFIPICFLITYHIVSVCCSKLEAVLTIRICSQSMPDPKRYRCGTVPQERKAPSKHKRRRLQIIQNASTVPQERKHSDRQSRPGTVPQERKAFRSPKPVQLRSPESGQKICQKKRKNGISMLKDQMQELQDETSDLRSQLAVTADLRSQLETKDEELEVMGASKLRIHQSLQIALKRALDAEHRLVCQQKDPKEGGQDVTQSNVWTKRDSRGWWKKRCQAAMTASGPKESAQSWRKRNGIQTCNGD